MAEGGGACGAASPLQEDLLYKQASWHHHCALYIVSTRFGIITTAEETELAEETKFPTLAKLGFNNFVTDLFNKELTICNHNVLIYSVSKRLYTSQEQNVHIILSIVFYIHCKRWCCTIKSWKNSKVSGFLPKPCKSVPLTGLGKQKGEIFKQLSLV